MWREELFPRFQGLCAAAHEEGAKVIMHSCGFIAGFYPGEQAIGLEPKWQDIACDEFVKHGVRPTTP